jgi:hypothetical protein
MSLYFRALTLASYICASTQTFIELRAHIHEHKPIELGMISIAALEKDFSTTCVCMYKPLRIAIYEGIGNSLKSMLPLFIHQPVHSVSYLNVFSYNSMA